jgi:hypothetical protein
MMAADEVGSRAFVWLWRGCDIEFEMVLCDWAMRLNREPALTTNYIQLFVNTKEERSSHPNSAAQNLSVVRKQRASCGVSYASSVPRITLSPEPCIVGLGVPRLRDDHTEHITGNHTRVMRNASTPSSVTQLHEPRTESCFRLSCCACVGLAML